MITINILIIICCCVPHSRSEYFDSITIKIFRGDQPVTLLQTDTVNDEDEVTEISIENENVPVLKTGVFHNLTKLKYVRVHRNNLEILESYAFWNVTALRIINLNFNRIQKIPENVFANLSVSKITLKGNGIKSLTPHAFYNLTSLQVLDLSSNRIEYLPKDLFVRTNNVKQLDLSYNQLQYYPDIIPYSYFEEAFASVNKYEDSYINLSFNNLTVISNMLLKGVQYVKELYLNDNNMIRIGDAAFLHLRWIETIDLQGNDLEELSDEILKVLATAQFAKLKNNPWSNDFVCKYETWCFNNDVLNIIDVSCNYSLLAR